MKSSYVFYIKCQGVVMISSSPDIVLLDIKKNEGREGEGEGEGKGTKEEEKGRG